MRHHRTQAGSDEHRRLDRAIVLDLLGDDHDERWQRDELAAAVRVERSVLDSALNRLHSAGVVVCDGEEVRASSCARFIDALELIGI
jgi:predicted transcriptional regulator